MPESQKRPVELEELVEAQEERPKLTWAVDLGNEMRALSTFDLWMGLSSGELPRSVKVWRVGREAWDAACDVPELACALRDLDDAPEDMLEAAEEEAPPRSTLEYSTRPPFGEDDTPAPSGGLRSPRPTPWGPTPTAPISLERAIERALELEVAPSDSPEPPASIETTPPPSSIVLPPRRVHRSRRVFAAGTLSAAAAGVAALLALTFASPSERAQAPTATAEQPARVEAKPEPKLGAAPPSTGAVALAQADAHKHARSFSPSTRGQARRGRR